MGDRGGVLIREDDGFIFLYTHWYGSRLLSDVKKGLKKLYNDDKGKLNEGDRVAGYIFREMAKHYDSTELLSVTIMPYDEEYVIRKLGKNDVLYRGDTPAKEFYKEIKGEVFLEVSPLIIIDENDVIIKNYSGDTIESTDLKDFMLKY